MFIKKIINAVFRNLKYLFEFLSFIKNILINKVSVRHSKNTLSYFDARDGISSVNTDLCKKEQEMVLIELFGKGIYDDYQLLKDYETGYCGMLKIIRKILSVIAGITFRRRKVNC